MSNVVDNFRKSFNLEQLKKGHLYPVTIVLDRYGGTYSGGKWLAIQDYQMPEEIGSSDPDEMLFWRSHKDEKLPIGRGETPDEALKDLMIKAQKYYESL